MRCRISLLSLIVGLLTLSSASPVLAQHSEMVRRLPRVETAPDGAADTSPASAATIQIAAVQEMDAAEGQPSPDPQTSVDASPAVRQEVSWSEAILAGPSVWFDRQAWKGSVEFGLNGSDGNAQSLSFRTGGNLRRTTDSSLLAIDMTYARTTANSIETQNNALLGIRQDWLFGESPWTVFAATTLEYDEFKAFDVRTAVNAGFGYQLIKTDATRLIGRFGSGFSREIGGPDDSYVPEAVFGLDFERQLTKRQKLIAKSDFLPDWSDFTNYRVVTTVGWEILLDDEANLSLKVGAIDRYDSTPNGRKANDFDYSLLLIWKL